LENNKIEENWDEYEGTNIHLGKLKIKFDQKVHCYFILFFSFNSI